MSGPLRIRTAVSSDSMDVLSMLQRLAEHEGAAQQPRLTKSALQRYIFSNTPNAHVLVAENDGVLIGFVLFFETFSSWTGGPTLHKVADGRRTSRGRIDWKYALGLELVDSGFDHTVLSEFRARLVEGKLELLLLDALLERVQELGLLKQRGKQRTDSTHVLAAVRTMNRLERVGRCCGRR